MVLALIAATSGTARGAIVPGLKISDVLMVLLAAAVLVRWGGRWRLIDGLGGAVLVYAAVYVAMTLVNFARRTELSLGVLPHELLGAPQYALLYVLAYAIGQKSRSLLTWLRPSMILACVMSVVAVLQVANIGPVRRILAAITGRDKILNPLDYQVYRGTGFFPSQHALGMYLCIHVVIAVVCLARVSLDDRDRRLMLATVLLSGIGILSTATASPALICVAAVFAFLLSTRRAAWAIGGIIALSAAALASPIGDNIADRLAIQYGSSESFSILPKSFWFRVDVWLRDFVPIITRNLWSGYGPVPENSHLFPYMESMYITVLMQGGVLLLGALIFLIVAALIRMHRVLSTVAVDDASLANPAARALRFLLVLMTLFMVIHPYLSDAGAAPLFFTALGMVSGLAYGASTGKRAYDRGQLFDDRALQK
ncbi:Lipid A core - O-antigen ligase and related enzymes [Mycolicibacterium tokaiense]|uniref:Lipid A core - O-antigen ligase and related enzymes n=1 Tax=Mycolicibacterium tokaiense TaxID=39695 RepID=A0A378TBZ0_9MYCO|nr:Lipid A core - O-antigen ligase and related enzymes [Mycolicibacterium tokaiense]